MRSLYLVNDWISNRPYEVYVRMGLMPMVVSLREQMQPVIAILLRVISTYRLAGRQSQQLALQQMERIPSIQMVLIALL